MSPPEGSTGRARVFAVVSWGCSATNWLAQVLDRHPSVRCFHAVNGDVFRMTRTPRLDGMKYVELLNAQRLGYPVVGDVHGFTRTSIPSVQAELGDLFRCAVLVRDPLPRYRSQLALFEHGEWRRWAAKGRLWDIDYVKPIARAAGIKLSNDYEKMLVVHSACLLNVILEETQIAPVVRMEDITSSPESLGSLFTTLTAGKIDGAGVWAEEAVARPPVVKHARGDELTVHQLDVLERIVKPEAWAAYRQLGYDC